MSIHGNRSTEECAAPPLGEDGDKDGDEDGEATITRGTNMAEYITVAYDSNRNGDVAKTAINQGAEYTGLIVGADCDLGEDITMERDVKRTKYATQTTEDDTDSGKVKKCPANFEKGKVLSYTNVM